MDAIYRAGDRQKFCDRAAKYHAEHPDQGRARSRRRRARIRGATIGFVDEAAVFACGVCYLCGLLIDMNLVWPDPMSKSIDHIVPLARGGSHTMDNLAPTHLHCNLEKGASI